MTPNEPRRLNLVLWIVVSLVVAVSLSACCKKSTSPDCPDPANVIPLFIEMTPPGTPCLNGCGSSNRWGTGFAVNQGERTAFNVKVRIKTECDEVLAYCYPETLGPGESGSFHVQNLRGCHPVRLTAEFDQQDCPGPKADRRQ